MKEICKKFLIRIIAVMLLFTSAVGVCAAVNPLQAEATTYTVKSKRYTRASIKFQYYPTSRNLGGGLQYKYQNDSYTTPTYCILWKGSTNLNNTVTATDLESIITNQDCLDGLYVIMQNGYAGGTNYTVAGINMASYSSDSDTKEELAYYATSWAIHLWLGRYGYEQTALVQNTANAMTWTASALRGYKSTHKVSNSTMGSSGTTLSNAAWSACMELLALAVEGNNQTATANVTLNSQTTEGNYFVIKLNITTTNATGWTLTYSLPSGSSVSKSNGTTSSDTVTVKIPITYASTRYTFTAIPTGTGKYVADSYEYIYGEGDRQGLVTWNPSITSTGEPGSVQVTTSSAPSAGLTIKKVDASTGDTLSGATFTIRYYFVEQTGGSCK